MSNSSPRKPRPAPLSVRFSEAEKAVLREKAAGVPLGRFIRSLALGAKMARPRGRLSPVKDDTELGRVLGLLGRTHLANNLNQLAKAANLGSLPVTQELEAELHQACTDIADMRAALLRALGLARADGDEEAVELPRAFAEAAE